MTTTRTDASRLAAKAISTVARTRPFYGSILLRLDVRPCEAQPTAWTDGKTVGWNPEFLASLSEAEARTVFAHEAMHVALLHMHRLRGRDAELWNQACDHVINLELIADGFTMPRGALSDPAFKNMSAEQVYDILEKQPKSKRKSFGSAGAGGLGSVRSAPSGLSEAESKQIVVSAAFAAKMAGRAPAFVERMLATATKPRVDWREVLRRYMVPARDELSFSRPSRRPCPEGTVFPGKDGEQMGPVVVAVDTSGSIGEKLLDLFGAEVQAVALEARPERVHVLYCDAAVGRADVFEAGEEITLHPVGGGGTDFRPVWQWIQEHGVSPECVIYLTDLCGEFPTESPYPTLWVYCGRGVPAGFVPPFGEVVAMGDE